MKFRARLRKTGTSFVVTIPSQYIQDGYINPDKEQIVEMVEATNDEGTSAHID